MPGYSRGLRSGDDLGPAPVPRSGRWRLGRPVMLRWRRLIVVAGVGLAVTALIGAGALLRGPAARSPVPARPETAVVTRQTLVAVTTVAGKLGYGPEQLIEPRVTGTVTAVPAVGAALQRGMVLFR